MASATLTSKGQITIPKSIRDLLGLHTGDRINFRTCEDGSVVVETETIDLMSLCGSVRTKVKGVSIEDMNLVIRKTAAQQ